MQCENTWPHGIPSRRTERFIQFFVSHGVVTLANEHTLDPQLNRLNRESTGLLQDTKLYTTHG